MFMYKGLISSINPRDTSAWQNIFLENSEKMYRIARYITGNDDDAKDVVQQTFNNAYTREKPYESLEEVNKYLQQKARWNALDRLRRIKNRKKHEGGYEAAPEAMHTPHYAKDDDDGTTWLKEAALNLLPKLPPQQQKIVHLTYWKDMTKKEVAAFLQISEYTVRNHLLRALITLAQQLGIKRNKERKAVFPGKHPEK